VNIFGFAGSWLYYLAKPRDVHTREQLRAAQVPDACDAFRKKEARGDQFFSINVEVHYSLRAEYASAM
jgi:hypothetical protein